MQRFYKILCLLLVLPLVGEAQITVTNSTFIAAGDEIIGYNVLMPGNVNLGTASSVGQTWDWSTLPQTGLDTIMVLQASMGPNFSDFPSADVFQEVAGSAAYAVIGSSTVDVIGLAGDVLGLGFDFVTPYQDPREIQFAPLSYPMSFTSTSKIFLQIDPEDYPQLDSFITASAPSVTVDSARLTIETTSAHEIDAFGIMQLPTGSHDVLRHYINTISNAIILVKVPIFGWVDPNSLPGVSLPFGGLDTTVIYEFQDATQKNPIAVANVDNFGVITDIQYSAISPLTNSSSISNSDYSVKVYPSPAIDHLNFVTTGLNPGYYKVIVRNVIGAEVLVEQVKMEPGRTTRLDLANLDRGTYLYNFLDDNGKTLATRRFIVIRP